MLEYDEKILFFLLSIFLPVNMVGLQYLFIKSISQYVLHSINMYYTVLICSTQYLYIYYTVLTVQAGSTM